MLGPLDVTGGDGPVRIGGRRRRTLLASLLLNAGHVVTMPAVIDTVWADDPPDSAVFNVRTYICDLRRLLRKAGDTPDRLESLPSGYRFHADSDELDLLRFTELAAEGTAAMNRGDHATAADRLSQALQLWRGRPFEDVAVAGGAILAQRVGLEEERLAVTSKWIEARLSLGQHEELVPMLRQTVAERPLHERARLQLITALQATGRTADALAVYRDAHRTAVDELGVEPGLELQQAHAAILHGTAPVPVRRRAA